MFPFDTPCKQQNITTKVFRCFQGGGVKREHWERMSQKKILDYWFIESGNQYTYN